MKTGLQESEPPGAEVFWVLAELFFCTAPAPTLETRTKGTKLEQKERNSNKRYETRGKGMKFEERVQNVK